MNNDIGEALDAHTGSGFAAPTSKELTMTSNASVSASAARSCESRAVALVTNTKRAERRAAANSVRVYLR